MINQGDFTVEHRRLQVTLERLLAIQAAEVKGALDEAALPSWKHSGAIERTPFCTTEGRRILVVNDEPDLRDAIRVYLEMQGYIVLQAADSAEAVAKVRTVLPDLVVLEMKMPVSNGISTLRDIRSLSAVPIIALNVKGEEVDTVQALRLGADDYVTQPFSLRELLARIESVLRRVSQASALPQETLAIDDDLTIDFARNRVIARGAEHMLTATEHRLLYHLVTNAGRLMPHETLLARVWGPEYREEVHYVRLYVSYLRAKIEPDPAHPKYILIEKGLGYRFVAEPQRGRMRQESRQGLVGLVSHKLKTPVAVITAYTEALLQEIERTGDSEEARILHRIDEQATRMLGLIDDLVDLQRLQSGQLALDESQFDLGVLAASVSKELQDITQTHRGSVDAMESVLVHADRHRIEEVIVNILENAINYSPDGSTITVTVRQTPRPNGRGTQAMLAVNDQGVGISPADLPFVFERFYQASGSQQHGGFPGLGVGLYIARGIVEQHGGKMWVVSTEGTGSTFYLTLPN
ncbi:MAG: response regulator transcription factor [Chloroflexi bacterium]|nr:response regulator transcription factor [Chloroflexota bacterium]